MKDSPVCEWTLCSYLCTNLVLVVCCNQIAHICCIICQSAAISRAQPRIEAKIDMKLLGGTTEEIVVKARLDVDSGLRFTETYESASVLGNTVDIPEALQYSRDLYVSYVDEDVLVVRDGSGVPEILVRK